MERSTIGKCYYCNKDVLVSKGQAIKWIIIKRHGEIKGEYPTHKACRKL